MVLAKADARIAAEYDRRLVPADAAADRHRSARAGCSAPSRGVLRGDRPPRTARVESGAAPIDRRPQSLRRSDQHRAGRAAPPGAAPDDESVRAALLVTINGIAADAEHGVDGRRHRPMYPAEMKVLLVVIDAATARVVSPAIKTGQLPTMQRLAEVGRLHESVTMFPSITPAATTTSSPVTTPRKAASSAPRGTTKGRRTSHTSAMISGSSPAKGFVHSSTISWSA